MAEETLPVAVVGGGIAGLTAAFRLHQRGVRFALLEASNRLGGVIRSEAERGFLMEAGPDAILAQKPEGLALCRELGLGDHLVPTNPHHTSVFILRRGRMHRMPDGLALTIPTRVLPFARASLFSWSAKLRMGMELLVPRGRARADESIASFMRRRFGREALELLGEPLLAGIHSGDAERLSIQATFPRFVEMEARRGSLIRAMLAAPRRPGSAGSRPSAFYSLVGGLEEMVGALVRRLPPHAVRRAWPVVAVQREGEGFVLTRSAGEPLRARAVILATPARHSAPLVAQTAPEAGRVLAAIPFVSTAVVFLGYRREQVRHVLDGYGVMIPRSEGLRTPAMSFFSTKWPGRAPEDHVLLRAFLGGAHDPGVLALDDSTLVEQARGEMTRLLGISGEPTLARLFRWPAGTPQMEVGHLERVAEVERRLAEIPGLFVGGAGLRATGIPDGVADATRVALAAAALVSA